MRVFFERDGALHDKYGPLDMQQVASQLNFLVRDRDLLIKRLVSLARQLEESNMALAEIDAIIGKTRRGQ